ncbi:MAG: MFS transporter [Actinobacteria bacterium]|nr:MFS transporter [Actinomycetota bacterium]
MPAGRVDAVRDNLDRLLAQSDGDGTAVPPSSQLRSGTGLTVERAIALFTDQVRSRELDIVARELRAADRGYYTISSAGHEHNAIVGALLRPTDPAFLHYRSGPFMMARARQIAGTDPVGDTVLSLMAAADDPVSGGRHKVWGGRDLWVVPQTSTIASHVPKATGFAFAHELVARNGLGADLPDDSIVCCSFGDASANHASALTGINAARYGARLGGGVPILFVCEDNGLGISVRTPRGWIASSFGELAHLEYIRASGEIDQVWDQVATAIERCRTGRVPVFLHLPTVRLWGHAGSDVESAYRQRREIEQDEARDPLLLAARRLLDTGAASGSLLREVVAGVRDEVAQAVERHADRRPLGDRDRIMAPIAPYSADAVADAASELGDDRRRARHFGDQLPESATAPSRRTLAAAINATLHDELLRRPNAVVFGEDVARKGGVYHVTAGLQEAFGPRRVFDTLLDETTVLGVAQGAGLRGLLPIPEIQYLAYLHNAIDQLRGEAASTGFLSAGQFRTPMVVRVASFAYQRGIGGHFHNDNAVGALREIPGLVIAVPSRGADAARMLRGALAMAEVDGRVVCFLEPIALYHTKDLYEDDDGRWLSDYPPPGEALLPGEVGVYGAEHRDLVIVTFGNGVRHALRAARRLADEHGRRARIVDLRWLAPLPLAAITEHAAACGRVLVADECRASGGIADAVLAHLVGRHFDGAMDAVRSADSYVPLGPSADVVLLSSDEILDAALKLLER